MLCPATASFEFLPQTHRKGEAHHLMDRYNRTETTSQVDRPLGLVSAEIGRVKRYGRDQGEHRVQSIKDDHHFHFVFGLGAMLPSGLLIYKPLAALPAIRVCFLIAFPAIRAKHTFLSFRRSESVDDQVESYRAACTNFNDG